MLDLGQFENLRLRSGFVVVEIRLTAEPLLDPLKRAAAAQTIIRGNRFHVFLRADLNEKELSVSIYHEVLEAATVAAERPPKDVLELNEGDFERAAYQAYDRFGIVSAESLNRMLATFGFPD